MIFVVWYRYFWLLLFFDLCVANSNTQETTEVTSEVNAVPVATFVSVSVGEENELIDAGPTSSFNQSEENLIEILTQLSTTVFIEETIQPEPPKSSDTKSYQQEQPANVLYEKQKEEENEEEDDDNYDEEEEFLEYEEDEYDEGSERMLSFEEWRKVNLQKSGQNDYTDRDPIQQREMSSSSHDINNVIDDELEIDPSLFSGSSDYNPIAADTPNSNEPNAHVNVNDGKDTNIHSIKSKSNENDNDNNNNDSQTSAADDIKAAGKFYKDRFNYASFDCAATIIKTNKEAKGAHNILTENKDSYMLNKCNAPNKFVIIELCQDILVDTVVIGTFEFFSSMFKDIRISVSDRFPPNTDNEWKVLGEFQGKSIRDFQGFHIKNPFIWARYLRIEFLSHWGQEFYCPVSVVRVHGTTMMEEYKSHGASKSQVTASKGLNKSVNHDETIDKNHEKLHHQGNSISGFSESKNELKEITDEKDKIDFNERTNDTGDASLLTDSLGDVRKTNHESKNDNDDGSIHTDNVKTCAKNGSGSSKLNETTLGDERKSENDSNSKSSSMYQCGEFDFIGNLSDKILFDSKPDFCQPMNKTSSASIKKRKVNTAPSLPPPPPPPPSSSPSPPQEPTTQESIYQTIMKRISLLESNATLSMQYIESQTQTLLERLLRVDRKYSAKIDNYLAELNTNVGKQYKHLREQRQRLQELVELQAANTSLRINDIETKLADAFDDLRYQKKVSIVQTCLLLVILFFVVATRGAAIDISPVNLGNSTNIHPLQTFRKSHSRGQKSFQSAGDSSSRHQLYHVRSLPLMRPGSYASSSCYASGDDEFGSGVGGDTSFDVLAANDASFDEDDVSPVPRPRSSITAYEYEKVYYEDIQQQSAYDAIPSPATSP